MALNQRCLFYTPNGKIEQAFRNVDRPTWKPGEINVFIIRGANGVGKTTIAVNLAGYLADRFPNKYLDSVRYLRNFKRPNRGRIYTTLNAASTSYKDETEKWLRRGTFTATKEGKTYDSKYTFHRTKSVFDLFSYERDPAQGESTTLDWAIVDEPIPKKFWPGLISRMRWGGPVFIVMTALDEAAWMNTELEVPERIGKDVYVTEVCAEDSCIEHGIRGHLPHAYIESQRANYDEDDIESRLGGKYKTLSGAVYKKFDMSVHVIPALLPYHEECIKTGHYNIRQIQDPHPRKPFVMGWYYIFPNGDVVNFAEFPDDSYPPFYKMKSCDLLIEDYAELIKATELPFEQGVDKRLMDPNMGNSPAEAGGRTYKQKFAGFQLYYEDPVDNLTLGHLAVKDMLGNPAKGRRPQFYILEWNKNHIFGMKNYGWKKLKSGLTSEEPELEHKDFPDLVRYGAMSGFRYSPPARFRRAQPPVWLPKAYRRKA